MVHNLFKEGRRFRTCQGARAAAHCEEQQPGLPQDGIPYLHVQSVLKEVSELVRGVGTGRPLAGLDRGSLMRAERAEIPRGKQAVDTAPHSLPSVLMTATDGFRLSAAAPPPD